MSPAKNARASDQIVSIDYVQDPLILHLVAKRCDGRNLAISQSTPAPIGQVTPVPPMPQYPPGFLARYCW